MIWHILISESVSVYGRYAVGLLSVWVRDCRSAVGYDSSIVLMVGFHSVSCRLSIGLKSGDPIPNLTRSDPNMNPTGFTVSSATLSVADSWPIHWKFCVFVGFVSVWPVWLGYKGAASEALYPSHTDQTDTKPTWNRHKSLNSGRDRFRVGINSVLSVWCRFMFGQTNLSRRDLSNMFERSLPDKLSVVCRLYVGVVSVLLGSVRGRVGLNSATDGRWFVGLRSVMCRAHVGRPDTDSRPIQDRINSDITLNCVESTDTFPNQNRR